jgi:hypothetical protein
MTERAVHLSDYASQPDVRILCDGSWTTPAWGPTSGMTETEGVYESDDNRLYTFDKDKTTCPKCAGLHGTDLARLFETFYTCGAGRGWTVERIVIPEALLGGAPFVVFKDADGVPRMYMPEEDYEAWLKV